jgi:hypothetical protein
MRKEEVFVLKSGVYALLALFVGGILQAYDALEFGLANAVCVCFLWGMYKLYESTAQVFSMFVQDDNDDKNTIEGNL